MTNPTPIQETWQEIAELIQMGVGLEDEETTVVLNILNEFAKPLLQRKERETREYMLGLADGITYEDGFGGRVNVRKDLLEYETLLTNLNKGNE